MNELTLPGLEALVAALLAERGRVWLALDGPSAAGKTTLAEALRARLGWTVLHMDDFFLRPEQRMPERYAAPGGNVDHERFRAELLEPLSRGETAFLRPLDCKTMTLGPAIPVEPAPVLLTEGAYACHPALWDFYDLHLFLPIDQGEQERRVLARNGPEQAAVFQSRWIPLERAYFAANRLPERCDYLLTL